MPVHIVKKLYLKMKNVPMTGEKDSLTYKSYSKTLIKNHYIVFRRDLFLNILVKRHFYKKETVFDLLYTPNNEID